MFIKVIASAIVGNLIGLVIASFLILSFVSKVEVDTVNITTTTTAQPYLISEVEKKVEGNKNQFDDMTKTQKQEFLEIMSIFETEEGRKTILEIGKSFSDLVEKK